MNRAQIDAITVRIASQLAIEHLDSGCAYAYLGGTLLDSASPSLRDQLALSGALLRIMIAVHGALLASHGLAPGVLPAEARERCRVVR